METLYHLNKQFFCSGNYNIDPQADYINNMKNTFWPVCESAKSLESADQPAGDAGSAGGI